MGEQPGCVDSLKVSRKTESPLIRVFFVKRETILLRARLLTGHSVRMLKML